jgi:hypothetical protein
MRERNNRGDEMDGGTLLYKRKKALNLIENSDLGQRSANFITRVTAR